MSKTYKGYELIKAIADGEIKEGTALLFRSTIVPATIEVYVKKDFAGLTLYDKKYRKILPTSWLFNSTIELLHRNKEDKQ